MDASACHTDGQQTEGVDCFDTRPPNKKVKGK